MKKYILKIITFTIFIFIALDLVYASPIGDYFKYSKAQNINPVTLRDTIFTILTYIGWALAICVTLVTGIQFLTSGAQKKAQLKEKLWLIVLAVFILAAGIPVLQLIGDIFLGFRAKLI